MSHYPVNHPLRPLYRVLAAIAGLYVLVFGVVGVVRAGGAPVFDRSDMVVLGLRTNLAFALMSIGAGAVILLAWFVGRNVDRVGEPLGRRRVHDGGHGDAGAAAHRIERAQLLDGHGDRVIRRSACCCSPPACTACTEPATSKAQAAA